MSNAVQIDPKVLATAEKIEAKRAEKEVKMRERIAERYPHALVDTLQYDESANKWKCNITCQETGNTDRVVYTSDLFQVKYCEEVAKRMKAEKRAERQEEIKEAQAFLRSKKELSEEAQEAKELAELEDEDNDS